MTVRKGIFQSKKNKIQLDALCACLYRIEFDYAYIYIAAYVKKGLWFMYYKVGKFTQIVSERHGFIVLSTKSILFI